MMLSITTTCNDDRSTDVCSGGYLNLTKSPKDQNEIPKIDDHDGDDDDDKSSVSSAFEFWSDMEDSCSETEPASFSMSSYSSLLGPNMNTARTVFATLNDSWCEKDSTKHVLNDDEIDLLIKDLQCDFFHSEEMAPRKKKKGKGKESKKLKKKKKRSTNVATKNKSEKRVIDEKRSRRKECKLAQEETEISLGVDDLTESTPSRSFVEQQPQQKPCPSIVFRSRPIGQPRFTPIPNYVVPAGPGPIVKTAETEVESISATEDGENVLVPRFSESEGDLYQKRRETGFKDLSLLQHIETCVNVRSNLRPVGDPEALRKAKLAEYIEKFRREKPRGRKTHGLSLVDVQTKLANLKSTTTKHIYGNNLQEEHYLVNDEGRYDL